MQDKVNKVMFCLSALSLLLITIYLYDNESHETLANGDDNNQSNSSISTTLVKSSDIIKPQMKINNSSAIPLNEKDFYEAKPAYKRYFDVQNWRTEKFGAGYIMPQELASYDYDIKTLEQMAFQGDFKAMHVLGRKYLENLDLKNADRIYQLATIYGSTSGLSSLARLRYPTESDDGKRRQASISRLAYYEVALRRGDQSFHDNIRQELSGYPELGIKSISLTDEEKLQINKTAEKIYQDIERNRLRLGLPELDNSIPDFVKDFYQQLAIDS